MTIWYCNNDGLQKRSERGHCSGCHMDSGAAGCGGLGFECATRAATALQMRHCRQELQVHAALARAIQLSHHKLITKMGQGVGGWVGWLSCTGPQTPPLLVLPPQQWTMIPPDPPPCVTLRRVAVCLRGPRQSPVLLFACCVGSLRFVGCCGRCSCWYCFRVRGAPSLACRGCAGCSGCRLCITLSPLQSCTWDAGPERPELPCKGRDPPARHRGRQTASTGTVQCPVPLV